ARELRLDTLHRTVANAMRLRRRDDPSTSLQGLSNRLLDLRGDLRPAHLLALGLRSRHAGLDALLDHGPLELCEYAQHPEHGLPGWRGVEALLVEVEVNALRVQLAEQGDEVLQ